MLLKVFGLRARNLKLQRRIRARAFRILGEGFLEADLEATWTWFLNSPCLP